MFRPSWHLGLGLALLAASAARAEDWPQFRGPQRDGICREKRVPLRWAPDRNIRWKAPLPGEGNSSPIVVGQQVYVTCATDAGARRGLYCFDRRSGDLAWRRIVEYSGDEPTHQTNPYCGSSPAAAQGRVVVWHASAGVHCYDEQGQELWSRDLGAFRHIWGYGSSPLIAGDRVVLNCGPGPRQFVIALDLASGQTLWQADEPGGDAGEKPPGEDGAKPWTGSWTTPVLIDVDGRSQVLVALARHVKAFDPVSGELLWKCEGTGDLAYTDPLVGGGLGVAMGGYHGAAIGFRLGGSGDITDSGRLWRNDSRNPQRIGSGVLIDGYVYMANEIGLAQCLDARTGAEIWRGRLPGPRIWSSII
ncbi:MAG TPA: PQQ-binding-like beta-propeller repeat protein, partial [Pirellulales bacterium]|nr:PQQ-binding-like beta-propeller repeat protein [Pirellulales bacterium]